MIDTEINKVQGQRREPKERKVLFLSFSLKIYFCLFLSASALFPFLNEACLSSLLEGHSISMGPQVYWMKRNREGGSKQTGILKGFWAEYERYLENGIYASVHFCNAKGPLNGRTGSDSKLRSHKKESEVEGRLGFCFALRQCPKFSTALFLGVGSFSSHNDFTQPSPILFNMETRFLFGAIGFKSMYAVTPFFSFGMLFEIQRPYDMLCKIKNHEELESITQFIREKVFYLIELPFIIKLEKRSYFQLGGAIVPFYHFRNYGRQTNFPFDYPKTRFHLLGARLEIKLFF